MAGLFLCFRGKKDLVVHQPLLKVFDVGSAVFDQAATDLMWWQSSTLISHFKNTADCERTVEAAEAANSVTSVVALRAPI